MHMSLGNEKHMRLKQKIQIDGDVILNNLINAKWDTIKEYITSKGYINEKYWVKRHDSKIIITNKNYIENFNNHFNINNLVDVNKKQYGTQFVIFKTQNNHFFAILKLIYYELILI